MATSDERTPDTVVLTYETTIDVIVNLTTGEVKTEDNGELADDPHYVALFCEGEFAGEADLVNGEVVGPEPGDQELIDRALDLFEEAARLKTVTKSTTPEEIA